MSKHLTIGWLVVATMAWTATASAQDATTGAIQGVVTDKATGETLAGVTVIATSPALQGTQQAITGGSGYYKITSLPPGLYTVTFYYSDLTVRKNEQQVSINKTTPVYVKMDTSQAGGEVINVEGRAPTIDPTSTNQGITLDQDYTKNIPVPGRTFESALGAAAGTQNDGVGVSFSGSSSLENQYIVDGVNTTGLSFGTVGSPIINDFIKEIEVITGGYQAEYGRATGGVVNVVTKQGSNEFHGSVFSYFTNDFLTAGPDASFTQSSAIDAEARTVYDLNFGFDLGGPIIKDTLWFYVGFAPRLLAVDIDKITRRRTDCRGILPDGTLSDCDPRPVAQGGFADGDFDEDRNGLLIFDTLDTTTRRSQQYDFQFVTKLNYLLAPEHQGQLTISGTPSQAESLGVTGSPAATSFDFTDLTTDTAVKWTSKFNDNKTELEALLGWHRSGFKADSIDDAANNVPRQNLVFGNLGTWSMLGFESSSTRAGCTDATDPAVDPYIFIENCPDAGVGYRVGGIGAMADTVEDRRTARLSAIQRVRAAGTHEFKGGVDLEDNFTNDQRLLSGNVSYTTLMGNTATPTFNTVEIFRFVQLAPPGSTGGQFGDICINENDEEVACDFTPDPNVEGSTFNWAAYLRDSWQILPNLTLNAGVRYEEQRLRYAEHLQGTTDPFTQEPVGTNAMVLRNMWAPRVGASYDWTKEGRSKAYGSYGRYYESIPMDLNTRSFGGESTYTTDYGFENCGPNPPGFGGPAGANCDESVRPNAPELFGSNILVAPGIKPQYLDEIVIGVEYEVAEDFKLGVNYNHRRIGRVIEDVSTDAADTYVLANPGEFSEDAENDLLDQIESLAMGDPDRALLQAELDQYRGIRIFDKPRREYNAVNVTGMKRFSRKFYMQGSYTYARTEGNYQGLFSSNNGQIDPNITSQYDLIELLSNRDGPLPQDRPHYFKLDGYYIFDLQKAGEITLGARARALSGTPINATGLHHQYGPNESFLLPRGSMGRTDAAYDLDLNFIYGRDLGRGMKLEVFAALFSIFNTQTQFNVDETYTIDAVNPVVGGEFSDLVFLKANNRQGGAETSEPVSRNANFLQTAGRYPPFSARLGARLTF